MLAQNVQNRGEAVKKFHGAGVLSSIEDSAAEWFLSKRIPDLAKQGTESVRYYASEFMSVQNCKRKRQLITLWKKQLLSWVGSEAINQLSTKVRPNCNYKTDGMDLDVDMYKGGNIDFSKMYPVELYSDTNDPTNPLCKRGYGFDIHKAIGKLPRPKAGYTPSKYKYMAKWSDEQLIKIWQMATIFVMTWEKGECDRQMVQSLDEIPYGKMAKWG